MKWGINTKTKNERDARQIVQRQECYAKSFHGEEIKNVRFVDCGFSFSKFHETNVRNVVFDQCDFSNFSLIGRGNVYGSYVFDAEFRKCNFFKANLDDHYRFKAKLIFCENIWKIGLPGHSSLGHGGTHYDSLDAYIINHGDFMKVHIAHAKFWGKVKDIDSTFKPGLGIKIFPDYARKFVKILEKEFCK